MVVGGDAMARSLIADLKTRGSAVIVAGPDKELSHRLAVKFGCRFVPWEALYTTIHDVLLVTRPAPVPGADEEPEVPEIKPGYLRAGMCVMDLSSLPRPTPLAREALARGCGMVDPRLVLATYAATVAGRLSGSEVAVPPLLEVIHGWVEDEEEDE
jgi:shikimate 5-dehydrogenase